MTFPRTFALCLCLVVAACKAGSNGNGQEKESEQGAAPVASSQAIKNSQVYHCKDNSVAFVDFMSDDRTVNLKNAWDGAAVVLTVSEGTNSFSGSGYELTVGPGSTVMLRRPDQAPQQCQSG